MAEGEKEEAEQKRQTGCLTQKEQTIPAGVCQRADMQIISFQISRCFEG